MQTGAIPFQFDLTDVVQRARRLVSNRLGDVTLNLPFVSIAVSPKDRERQIAQEIVIRLKDRRVLSARECCDDCIDRALTSLQEIRRTLVDKQVELADVQDGPLYLLVDAMVLGIRQFLTFEQRLRAIDELPADRARPDFRRVPDVRQAYLDALEILRGHLSRSLAQVAAVAGVNLPSGGLTLHYQGAWPLEAYRVPEQQGPE
jgi:hypothetical protein